MESAAVSSREQDMAPELSTFFKELANAGVCLWGVNSVF